MMMCNLSSESWACSISPISGLLGLWIADKSFSLYSAFAWINYWIFHHFKLLLARVTNWMCWMLIQLSGLLRWNLFFLFVSSYSWAYSPNIQMIWNKKIIISVSLLSWYFEFHRLFLGFLRNFEGIKCKTNLNNSFILNNHSVFSIG